MRIGLIKPSYPNEKRVALLPDDIGGYDNDLMIEQGFGSFLGISDCEYVSKGCVVKSREEIFSECEALFCLKLMQPSDYPNIRKGQLIAGWTHPTGSGREFFESVAKPRELSIVDLDNIYPSLCFKDRQVRIPWIPSNFIRENSVMAGMSSTLHALISFGYLPDSSTKVAILAPGNVSQGAMLIMSKFNCNIRMFYRKTMVDFYDTIADYDIIINGIEVDSPGEHIITKEQLSCLKQGTFIIDAAADAGNAIEGTHYTSIDDPVYEEGGIMFYEVNNSPSVLFRKASTIISKSLSKWVFARNFQDYYKLIK